MMDEQEWWHLNGGGDGGSELYDEQEEAPEHLEQADDADSGVEEEEQEAEEANVPPGWQGQGNWGQHWQGEWPWMWGWGLPMPRYLVSSVYHFVWWFFVAVVTVTLLVPVNSYSHPDWHW